MNPLSASLLLLLTGSAVAQTFVVDAGNPPGSVLRDLPSAIAAVPSGATLRVMPGAYTPFAIANMSLTVIAIDPSMTFLTSGNVSIGPLASHQSVRIAGLRLTQDNASRLLLNSCDGPVTIQNFNGNPALTRSCVAITHCANVHLDQVHAGGMANLGQRATPGIAITNSNVEINWSKIRGGTTDLVGVSNAAAVAVAAGSHVTMFNCRITGADGLLFNSPPLDGGPGLQVDGGSFVQVVSSILVLERVTGGYGTSTFGPQSGNGGPGAIITNGSTLAVLGGQLLGGGPGSGAQNPGMPGPRAVTDPTSTLTYSPLDRSPIAVLTSPLTAGSTSEIRCFATEYHGPATPAVLMIGTQTRYLPLPSLAVGVLGLDPLVTIGPVFAPSGHWHSMPVALPPNFPVDFTIAAQFLTLHPQRNELRTTNTLVTTSR